MNKLPQAVIDTDHRLEQATESASADLAKHRWHWTLDESNEKRVTFTAYGVSVGRDESTIRRYARLHEELTISASSRRFEDVRATAWMGAETEAVTEAIAEARDRSINTVRTTPRLQQEVKQVRSLARQRAEEKGTTVEEEAKQVALNIVKAEDAIERGDAAAAELASKSGLGFIQLEAALQVAKRDLVEALHIADRLALKDNEREHIRYLVDRLREVINMVDAKITGGVVVDWDSELLQIAGKEI